MFELAQQQTPCMHIHTHTHLHTNLAKSNQLNGVSWQSANWLHTRDSTRSKAYHTKITFFSVYFASNLSLTHSSTKDIVASWIFSPFLFFVLFDTNTDAAHKHPTECPQFEERKKNPTQNDSGFPLYFTTVRHFYFNQTDVVFFWRIYVSKREEKTFSFLWLTSRERKKNALRYHNKMPAELVNLLRTK